MTLIEMGETISISERGREVGRQMGEGVGTIYGIRYFLVPNKRQKSKSSLKSNLMKE